MSKILLSIKPEYAFRILSGEKKYEYRKRLAKDVDSIVIYCTVPVCRVLGEVQVVDTMSGSPTALWEMTKNNSGICREKYRAYFRKRKNAYAYCLGTVIAYDEPKDLSEFKISHAPQSFVYLQKQE